ncbi:hypothetical protein [Sphingomonas sp.]|uniref:hypothetical protein n=1 Tax=Sphingomonas sp. TaxID=28214 RepID=UPI000DB58DD8|nr:hypothetical protein [Sphingomonas sp.]PZU07578.1 MAG: hypothetical protein DI605_16130 [Sphingomonas sp.]
MAFAAPLAAAPAPAASRPYDMPLSVADRLPNFPKGIDDDTHFSEPGSRAVANIVARALKTLDLPVSSSVRAEWPDLARDTSLGSTACH